MPSSFTGKPLRARQFSTIFWHTFILLIFVLAALVVGWVQSFRVINDRSYADAAAQQIINVTNLTKYALLTADPIYRPDLLMVLATQEGVRIAPKEASDVYKPLEMGFSNTAIEDIKKNIAFALGSNTIIAEEVNGEKGIWVSMMIDDDDYWLLTASTIVNPRYGQNWYWWIIASIVSTIIGSSLLAYRFVQPLKKLSQAACDFGHGITPQPLPEDKGSAELRDLNRSFNLMVDDINRMQKDREILLASVSHDLRTPITRLRLETEMADLPEDTREAMVSDLEQMEGIMNQFMDYARRTTTKPEIINLSDIVSGTIRNTRVSIDPGVRLQSDIEPNVFTLAHPTEMGRVVENLITNALRYGRSEDGVLDLSISLKKTAKTVLLTVADQGTGLDLSDQDRLMRPFERGDQARSNIKGTGLGLAIVDRIVKQSGGQITLSATKPHGLTVQIALSASSVS